MNKYLSNNLLLFLILFVSRSLTFSQEISINNIEELFDKYIKLEKFSGTVLIAKNSKILFLKSFGFSNRETNTLNKPDTKFNICSMGKIFTATAIMKLVQEGRLELNVPIKNYLPDFPENNSKIITVHHLLSHTSGLGNYMNRNNYYDIIPQLKTISDHYQLVKNEILQFEPGVKFSYSNSGYIVLGKIIENVSDQSYYDYIREKIFKPLKMEDSEFYLIDQKVPDKAVGYTKTKSGEYKSSLYPIPNPASDGGVYSTALDIFKFDQALHNNLVLSEKYKDKMFSPNLNDYGYGFSIKPAREHISEKISIGHTGGWMNLSAVYRHFIEDNIIIIVLSNYAGVAFEVARNIEAVIYGKSYSISQ